MVRKLCIFLSLLLFFSCLEVITQEEIIEIEKYILPTPLAINPMQNAQIYFPPNRKFATFQYTYPNISLKEENTFIFLGLNKLQPIDFELVAERKGNKRNKFDKYESKITDYLLTK